MRARVWAHQLALDRDLASGVHPSASPEHTLRACQLVTARTCRELAAELDSVLAKAQHHPTWHSASVPVQTAAVRDCLDQLRSLRSALMQATRPSLRGAALTSWLLGDHDGPLYRHSSGQTLSELADEATAALRQ